MQARVIEVFQIKAGMSGLRHAPGLVAVFQAPKSKGRARKGLAVRVVRPNETSLDLVVGEVKTNASTHSFFFEGISRDDIPVGSLLTWIPRIEVTPRSTRVKRSLSVRN